MTAAVEQLDDALLRLRRLWSASRHRIVQDGTSPIELSSLLVVEACARRMAAGAEAHVGDVAALADVAPSTASRLVDAAERGGLLRRQPAARSARQVALVLTPAGAELQHRAAAARRTWLAELVADWSPAEVDRLGVLLQRFADEVADRAVPEFPSRY